MAAHPNDDPEAAAARAVLGGASMARWLTPTAESRIERIRTSTIHDRDWPAAGGGDDDAALAAVRQSVATHGIVEPLLLRPRGDRFEVVTGSRRFRVALELGLPTVPAIVRDLDEAATLVATLWAVAGRRHLRPEESRALHARLVGAGIAEDEASALVDAMQPAGPSFVVSRAPRPHSQLRAALDDRPRHQRFVAFSPPQPPVLPQPATTALITVLRALDPAVILRPDL